MPFPVLAVHPTRTRRRSPTAAPSRLRRILERLRGEAGKPAGERREPIDKPFPFFGE
jgi:hypothetical protein